jgi:hypothetical protein
VVGAFEFCYVCVDFTFKISIWERKNINSKNSKDTDRSQIYRGQVLMLTK